MFNIDDVKRVSKILNIKFDKFTPLDLLNGMNIELEHGLVNPETNVSNDDLVITTKIALAHLNEFPNYYNSIYGIKTFEDYLRSKLK